MRGRILTLEQVDNGVIIDYGTKRIVYNVVPLGVREIVAWLCDFNREKAEKLIQDSQTKKRNDLIGFEAYT